jgi:hypothetical protein
MHIDRWYASHAKAAIAGRSTQTNVTNGEKAPAAGVELKIVATLRHSYFPLNVCPHLGQMTGSGSGSSSIRTAPAGREKHVANVIRNGHGPVLIVHDVLNAVVADLVRSAVHLELH